MCEIIRALISGGVIEGARLDDLSTEVIDGIDCPGESDESSINKFCIIEIYIFLFIFDVN